MRRSPRLRRLESDWKAMQQLQAESSLIHITTPATPFAGPPEVYVVRFRGRGVWKPDGSDEILLREGHEILIRLGASYPRMIPELAWRTPIFHPNISANGVVCLGGYSTHWAPGLRLDELCVMLWDMARYANYDVDSPYNRAASYWARSQTQFRFPIDARPLRDRIVRPATTCHARPVTPFPGVDAAVPGSAMLPLAAAREPVVAELVFVDDEIVDAEIVAEDRWRGKPSDVLYIG
jgi:hypothetical protein